MRGLEKNLLKVLVADDEYWIRENLRALLDWEAYGFLFLEPAKDGEDALHKMGACAPDILVTDVNMPFCSGIALLQQVSKEFPGTSTVVLSGYDDFAYVRDAMRAGALDYLLKPVQKSDLLQVLLRCTEQITNSREQQARQEKICRKLKLATSMLQDQKFSQLIHHTGDARQDQAARRELESYELEFSGFSLVMFTLSAAPKQHSAAGEEWSLHCKELICGKVGADAKSFAFHYAYQANIFLLITDLPGERLKSLAASLVKELEYFNHVGVNASVSHYYFTFEHLRDAYNDAVLARMACRFQAHGLVACIDDVKDTGISKRITVEQEKQLSLAAQTGNGALFREVALGPTGLKDCVRDRWKVVEVHQTAESLLQILKNHLYAQSASTQLLALENLGTSILHAVDCGDSAMFFELLGQAIDEFFVPPSPGEPGKGIRQTIAQVRDFIEQNYFEDLSLSSLARQFMIESSYLSRSFKQVAGCNLMLYIARTRMTHARTYMEKGTFNLTEISQLVGYDDYAYFNRVFRKIVGKGPREYRETCLKGESPA